MPNGELLFFGPPVASRWAGPSRCVWPGRSRPRWAGRGRCRWPRPAGLGCGSTAGGARRHGPPVPARADLHGHGQPGGADHRRAGGRPAGRGAGRVRQPRRRLAERGADRRPAGTARRPGRPGHRRRPAGRSGGAGGGHEPRVGVRGPRPRVDGSARRPGRADPGVVQVRPDAVVVVNAGSPVTMDWADQAGAVLQAWFGGQEMGHAVVDVLTRGHRSRRSAAHEHPRAPRAQPLVRELPGRERPDPIRRRSADGLPELRGSPPAGAGPVRPRPVLHQLRDRGADAVGHHLRTRDPAHGGGHRDQHRCPAGLGGGAVLRGPAGAHGAAAAQGAQGVRQGVAGAGGVHHGVAAVGRARPSPTGGRRIRSARPWRPTSRRGSRRRGRRRARRPGRGG